ncbi:MAG: tyrosine-type recombinase/integrase [Nitrososphaerota archaeon]|nr:tyrosine-type recombinase/integrase [Nitrososphaerota archaeon]
MTDSEQFLYELNQSISPTYRALLQAESLRRWIQRLLIENEEFAISTAKGYLAQINSFCEFAGKGPDAIIEEARSQGVSYQYEDLLDKWFTELKDRFGDQRDTAISKIGTVLSFFKRNRIKLNYDIPKKSKKTPFPFAPEKELLRKAFLSVPPSNNTLRSWIIMQSQCGLSEIDLLHLDVDVSNAGKDQWLPAFASFREQYNKGLCPISLVIVRQKSHQVTISFLGEEVLPFVKFYGSRLWPWKQDAVDPGKTVRKAFKSIQTTIGERRFRPHTLRHYFKTVLDDCDFHPNTVKRMMGHSLGKTEGAYNAAEVEKLKAKYRVAYPKLRLFEPEFKGCLATLTAKDFPS